MERHSQTEVLSSAGVWPDQEGKPQRAFAMLLQEIEARLRQKVASVNPDLSLPIEIAKRVSGAPGSAAYGEHKGGDTASKVCQCPRPSPAAQENI